MIMARRDREGCHHFVFFGDGRFEDQKEMWEYGGNHHEKLGLRKILCASHLTILNMAGTAPDPAGKNSDKRSSETNQASRTLDFCHPHISSILFPSLSSFCLSRLELYHHRRTQSEVILSISSCHDQELTLSRASTQHCRSSLHSHDYKVTPECSLSFRRASLQDQPALLQSSKVNIPRPLSPGCGPTSWWVECQDP